MEKNEQMQKYNQELEQELADIQEQVTEKTEAKSKKKRESQDRLENATRIYHDEMFLAKGYIKAFCQMKNLLFSEPETEFGFSIDTFKLNVYYVSKVNQHALLPLAIRLLSHQEFEEVKRKRDDSNGDDSFLGSFKDQHSYEEGSSEEEDHHYRQYLGLSVGEVYFTFDNEHS